MNRNITGSGIALLALFAAPACTSAWYAASADREVGALLRTRTDEVLGDRESWVIQPETAAARSDAPAAEPPAESPPAAAEFSDIPDEVDLETALRTAVQLNRDYLDREEALYLQGLGTTRANFDFGPQLAASINPFASKIEKSPTVDDLQANVSASQILPTGGNLSVTSNYTTDNQGRTLGLGLAQPLLRGFGYEVSHEALTQAQRSLIYEIRSFELFRQDFSIGIAQRYFDLVTQKRTLENDQANVDQATFDREKAEALFKVGRNDQQDIFRARRREIETDDQLIDARTRYRRNLDDFKIAMGIPTSVDFDIVDTDPPFEPIRIDLESAIVAAKHNRLDLLTQRDLVDDAQRAVRIADNGLLPDLNLNLDTDFDDSGGRNGAGLWSGSANLMVEIPLQRTPERNNYRTALINLAQTQRRLSLLLDQLELDIRDQLRQLDSLEKRIFLQREQIAQQQRAVTVSEFQYERGDLENRDLLEARQSLVDAQNSLIQLQTDHFIRRLTLLRNLGVLFVNENGEWQ